MQQQVGGAVQLKEQAGEWWEEYFGRKKKRLLGENMRGKLWEENMDEILWEEKRNTWKIGNEQGGRRD